MELDILADMEVDKVADIEVDIVTDMEVDIVSDIKIDLNIDIKIDIHINMEIQFGERVGHRDWLIGPKLFSKLTRLSDPLYGNARILGTFGVPTPP